MNKVRNIFIVIGLETILTLIVFWAIHGEHFVTGQVDAHELTVILLILSMLVILIRYIRWMDGAVLDRMIHKESTMRMEAFDMEQEIRNHEVFRDLQMIKVLAETDNIEVLEEFIS